MDAAANDPRYGAGQYRDFPGTSTPYQNNVPIPGSDDNGAAAKAAINAWTATGGGDTPEANLVPLHKLVSAARFQPDRRVVR